MNNNAAIFVCLAIISLFLSILISYTLRFYVNKDKLASYRSIQDLWKSPYPPKEVLNNKGMMLYRCMEVGFVMFAVFILTAIVLGNI